LLRIGQALSIGTLLFFLVPFLTRQIQQALYPQLERTEVTPTPIPGEGVEGFNAPVAANNAATPRRAGASSKELMLRYGLVTTASSMSDSPAAPAQSQASFENLRQDVKARIQTGPGLPEWTWRSVSFGWKGPVQGSQRLHPVLIPQPVERLLTLLRTVLLLALGTTLLRQGRSQAGTTNPPVSKGTPAATTAAATVVLWLASTLFTGTSLQAAEAPARMNPPSQTPTIPAGVPDATTLETLRKRLLEKSDAFPNAASISAVAMKLSGQQLQMDVEIHCAAEAAVPLPGRLPAYSPLSVVVNGRWAAALRRDDGYLWVVLPPGVHRVRVEALLTNTGDWEWSYLLKPRQVTIDAPDWTVVGVRADGVPEQQVFFSPKLKVAAAAATYDRQDLQPIVAVERRLELGLQWQIRTVIQRLSPVGKAVSMRIPLLPGENVLSQGRVVKDGGMEVRLGAQDTSFSWESSLAPVETLALATRPTDTWIERWHLVASPVWNVSLSGLPPVFESGNTQLEPVWQPWPGESVNLKIHRPEAIAGATVTVNRAIHEVTLGQRQRLSTLHLSIRCSLGEDFLIELPAEADITRLTHFGQEIPVRREGSKLVIPLRPGEQLLSVGWKENLPLALRADNGAVGLPVESANIQSSLGVGEDRWVLWASGPRRGPAVRFWVILLTSLLMAVALGRVPKSPLRSLQWMLLMIGLTQVPLWAAFTVIGWFFLLQWRGHERFQTLHWLGYNASQVGLVALTATALGILLFAVSAGLLGNPKMFILGNGSTSTLLRWFQARSEGTSLPMCSCVSVSIWWYRFAMLLWALWLAISVLGWLGSAWKSFASGGFFRQRPQRAPKATIPQPPTIPPLETSPLDKASPASPPPSKGNGN
jgi:hypothetical protein